jgi:hypothetical protein
MSHCSFLLTLFWLGGKLIKTEGYLFFGEEIEMEAHNVVWLFPWIFVFLYEREVNGSA